MRLVPVDTAVRDFQVAPVTDDEAKASFKAAVRLFGKWGVTDDEASTLLDMKVRTYRRWKVEGAADIGRDAKARLSNLMGIHKALRIVFGDTERVYGWVRSPNETFDGRTALDVMLGGDLTDLMRVRRYLDAVRGGW